MVTPYIAYLRIAYWWAILSALIIRIAYHNYENLFSCFIRTHTMHRVWGGSLFIIICVFKCLLKSITGKLYNFMFLSSKMRASPQNASPRGVKVTLVVFFFTFLHYAFSNVSSYDLPVRMHSHIDCTCLAFLHCGFSNVSSKCLPVKMHSHLTALVWFFSTVGFQMSPQIA